MEYYGRHKFSRKAVDIRIEEKSDLIWGWFTILFLFVIIILILVKMFNDLPVIEEEPKQTYRNSIDFGKNLASNEL